MKFIKGFYRNVLGDGRSVTSRSRCRCSRPRWGAHLLEVLEERRVPVASINPSPMPPAYEIAGSPAWFQANLADPGIRNLAQADFTNHGSLTRADMLAIFSEVESQGAMTAPELHDLRFLAANPDALHMPDDVQYETSEMVNDYASYQGTFIGNLDVGSPVSLQVEMVDKYFMGMDHPQAATPYSSAFGNMTTPTADASASSSAGLSLFAAGGPSYLNVHQGNVGDCWLMGSLAAVAASHPTIIQDMFTDEGPAEETVTVPNTRIATTVQVEIWSVRFFAPTGQACYVTVDSMLPSGGGYYDHPSMNGLLGNGSLWAALAEKAYAQANGEDVVTVDSSFSGINEYAALDGGRPTWALQAVVGSQVPYSQEPYVDNPGDVTAALAAGKNIVVLDTNCNPVSNMLVPDHSYALVYDNPSAPSPFEVYNPWGTTAANLAPSPFNGHTVWGQFTTNQAFLTAYFGNCASNPTAPSAAGTGGVATDPTHGAVALGNDALGAAASQNGLRLGAADFRTAGEAVFAEIGSAGAPRNDLSIW